MKTLKPVNYNKKIEEKLEKAVFKVIHDALFKEVFEVIRKYNVQVFLNANGALREALRSGRLQYEGGNFTGKFNIKLSKELKKLGATFNAKNKRWTLNEKLMPADLQSAVVVAQNRFTQLYADVTKALSGNNIDEAIKRANLTDEFQATIHDLEKQFKKSISLLGVVPKISEGTVTALAESFNFNMKLYISKWAEQDIIKLREKVEVNAFKGARAEVLVKGIQREYGVSQRKAKFLASQETRLITGQFTKERYKGAGVTKYRWSTSNDSRVRSEHKHLHGKIFQWDEAIIDDKGTHGNPKEAFGCRCKAIPILD